MLDTRRFGESSDLPVRVVAAISRLSTGSPPIAHAIGSVGLRWESRNRLRVDAMTRQRHFEGCRMALRVFLRHMRDRPAVDPGE
jgi:hypothetical protein